MKKIPNLVREWFSPKSIQDLDIQDILAGMADPIIRKIWIADIFDELQRLNLEVDRRLLSGNDFHITDLAARRKAYQDILESVRSARRRAKGSNPQSYLDGVTVQAV
jgi:hypothetical protein